MFVTTPYDDNAITHLNVDKTGHEIDNAINRIHKAPINIVDGNLPDVSLSTIQIFQYWDKFQIIGSFGIGETRVSGIEAVYVYCEEQEELQQLLLLSKSLMSMCDNYYELFENAAHILSS